jgi:GST-like protein
MNPNGQIPVIVDSDGPGGKPVTISQSVAVLMYCAEKSGKFLPKDAAARPAFWQALASAASDMSGMVTAIFTLSRAKEQHGPALDTFKSMWKSYLKVWDDTLAKQRYCAGGDVTVADFALYGLVARVKAAQPALFEGFANVARWADAMAARPAIQRAMKF